MGLSVTDWALLALLAVSIVLVCVAAGAYYGKRPVYPSTMTVREAAEPEQEKRYHASRHAAQEPGEGTQRLKGYPLYPGGSQ
jgi:hypothetical protein